MEKGKENEKKFECKGKLVIIEGTDGSGKSTLVKEVAEKLRKINPDRKVIISREPGGCEQSERIRNVMLPTGESKDLEFDYMTEVLLFAASRRENMVRILPELEKGSIVLVDRHLMSSLVWQGRKSPNVNLILDIDAISMAGLPMDVIEPIMFYLAIDTDTAQLRRASQKGYDLNKNDRLPIEELRIIGNVYDDMFNNIDKMPNFQKYTVKKLNAELSTDKLSTYCSKMIDLSLDPVLQ